MDSNQFLNYFNDLFDHNSNDTIIKAAEGIVSLVELGQKISKRENTGISSNLKYKLYLNICENPSEDILYTMRRLVGGIASTGVEARRGFLLTYSLLIEKFRNILNFRELISVIEKEATFSKSEKNFIKNCAVTGKIAMLKSMLDLHLIGQDVILFAMKSLIDVLANSPTLLLEEPLIWVIIEQFNRFNSFYYEELNNQKKFERFFEKFLNLFQNVLPAKTRFDKLRKLNEMSLYFLFGQFKNVKENQSMANLIKNYSNADVTDLFNGKNLLNYFKLLIKEKTKEDEFHMSFNLFCKFLLGSDEKTVYNTWNILVDESVHNELKAISPKIYQLLIFKVSELFLKDRFVLKYVKEIFDSSYFENILKFSSNKKNKYLNVIIEHLSTKLRQSEEKEMVSQYAGDLLLAFGPDPLQHLSPQSYRGFFVFLFSQINTEQRINFIESRIKKESEDQIEEYMFNLTVLKQLMIISEANLSTEERNTILEFFYKQYFDNSVQTFDIELENLIEDRMLLVLFSNFRDKNSSKSIPDKTAIKILTKAHKLFQKTVNADKIENVDLDDFKTYNKFYRKFLLLIKNETETRDDKFQSIVKLGLVILFLFVKTPTEYTDIITDLLQIAKFDADWSKVYTDIIILLLHKGNNTLADFAMNNFKKMAKHIDQEGFMTISGFLTENKRQEEDIEMMEDLNGDQDENEQ